MRDASADDATTIGPLHVRAWRAAYAGLMPQALLDGLDPERRTAVWREQLAGTDPTTTLVLVEDGAVLGFANLGVLADDPTTGMLWALYVEPDRVGSGLGRVLHDEALARLAEAGASRAQLDVLPGNARARRFYEIAGWTAQGDPFVVRHGEHELPHQRYVRDLAQTQR